MPEYYDLWSSVGCTGMRSLVGLLLLGCTTCSLASAQFVSTVVERPAAISATAEKANRSITNPLRAYPPSCLQLPLPTSPSGPALTATTAFRSKFDGVTLRPVEVTIWRKPCGTEKGAILVTVEAAPLDWLDIPLFIGRQAGKDIFFRLATEPNTLVQGTSDDIIPSSGTRTYTLEVAEATEFVPDLNEEFALALVYLPSDTVIAPAVVPAYNPNAYADASNPLPLSGYVTGSYFDPNFPGEGMLLEVAEVGETLVMVISWYTFDVEGFPLWLTGAAPVAPGATSVTVDLAGKFGGSFAGGFQPADLTDLPWGSVTVSFPSCRALQFSFASAHSLPDFLPTGTGSRSWARLTSVNRLACE